MGLLAGVVLVGLVIVIASTAGSSSNTSSVMATTTAQSSAATAQVIQAAAMPVGSQKELNQMGVDLLKQGRCDEAVQQFQVAYDANPNAYEAYEPLNNMAFCLYDLGRIEEATARWRDALGKEPNSPDANAGLGLALYTSGQQTEGLELYQKAIRLQPGYGDETYLRDRVFWSQHAIETSRGLRARATE
jgi:Tfp pilus assembly protein PilF